MAQNILGQDVPIEVETKAHEIACIGGVKYVYREGEYGEGYPFASVGGQQAARFRSENYENFKLPLGNGWVAFHSPSYAPVEVIDFPEGDVPALPPSRLGLITETKKIDGSPLIFRVEDEDFFVAPSNPGKAFRLQKLLVDDGSGLENGHLEVRISYYMIAHKPRMKGKWAFGQFAPMMTLAEVRLITDKLERKGWLVTTPPEPVGEA